MTNRGTARKMNIYMKRVDVDGKEIKPPKRLILKQNIEAHRLKHPNDLISFGEEPQEKEVTYLRPKVKTLPKKKKNALRESIKAGERDDIHKGYSRKILHRIATIRFKLICNYREADVSVLPVDNEGETIMHPSGRGAGKYGIIDWLIKYNTFYNEIQEHMKLDADIKQTLL